MNTGKEIITKFHSIRDAELSLADTQWLIQNIDKTINSIKQAGQVEPEVKPEIAVEYKDGWIIVLKQGDIIISYPKSDVKQFIEDLSRALNGEKLGILYGIKPPKQMENKTKTKL